MLWIEGASLRSSGDGVADWPGDCLPPVISERRLSAQGEFCSSGFSTAGVGGVEESTDTTELMGKIRSVDSGLRFGSFRTNIPGADGEGSSSFAKLRTRSGSGLEPCSSGVFLGARGFRDLNILLLLILSLCRRRGWFHFNVQSRVPMLSEGQQYYVRHVGAGSLEDVSSESMITGRIGRSMDIFTYSYS